MNLMTLRLEGAEDYLNGSVPHQAVLNIKEAWLGGCRLADISELYGALRRGEIVTVKGLDIKEFRGESEAVLLAESPLYLIFEAGEIRLVMK